MFETIMNFFKKFNKNEKSANNSKEAAKERLHLVLMQDRANVSADFLELMKQEIIEVIKKYIDVDESAIDVRLTNKENEDGTNGAPALYANIPILNIKNEARKVENKEEKNKKEEVNQLAEQPEKKVVKKENKKENKKGNESNKEDEVSKKEEEKEEKKIEEVNEQEKENVNSEEKEEKEKSEKQSKEEAKSEN